MPELSDLLPDDQGKTIGEIGLTGLLPDSIGKDPGILALARAGEMEFLNFAEKIPSVLLWSAITSMEEPLLTHLAVQLHTDLWDDTWSLAVKRDFLFRQALLHQKKGTAWAVEEAVRIIYGLGFVHEWFEYGGDRGCFALWVPVLENGLDEAVIGKIEMMVEKYKRKSQHLCALHFGIESPESVYVGACNITDEDLTVYPWMPEELRAKNTLYVVSGVDLFETLTLYEES